MPLAQSPGEVTALAGAGPEAAISHQDRLSGNAATRACYRFSIDAGVCGRWVKIAPVAGGWDCVSTLLERASTSGLQLARGRC
jgi:hypothetical protein